MNSHPLVSQTVEEAMQMQFDLVDAITREFSGIDFLSMGDLGIHPSGNIPQTTRKVEKVIARFFGQQASVFVRGAGTGAIREALASLLRAGDTLLVHAAPIYSTTKTTLDQLGVHVHLCDYNDQEALRETLQNHPEIKAVLIQYTRQNLEDDYDMQETIDLIKATKPVPVITDDNYAIMKVKHSGAQLGADLSCFSCFKLLGPEGVGCVIGKKKYIDVIHGYHYSGGSQTQGFEALEALRALVYAPVTHAVQAIETEKIVNKLNQASVPEIESALVVNAQSKVILVKFKRPIAPDVLEQAQLLGAAPFPVGAESKYEVLPMFYRLSGTMRQSDPSYETHWIRINPMRSGAQTVLRILETAITKVISCS